MITRVVGKLLEKSDSRAVVMVGGLGLKLYLVPRDISVLPAVGETITLHSFLNVKENGLDLYGFLTPESLAFFELLISVSGVGPKSALAIMEVAELNQLAAAIKEGRPDLLAQASGIGRKTAERIIVDLRGRVQSDLSEAAVRVMDSDADLLDTLVGLGYRRDQAKAALGRLEPSLVGLEDRLRAALKVLNDRQGHV